MIIAEVSRVASGEKLDRGDEEPGGVLEVLGEAPITMSQAGDRYDPPMREHLKASNDLVGALADGPRAFQLAARVTAIREDIAAARGSAGR